MDFCEAATALRRGAWPLRTFIGRFRAARLPPRHRTSPRRGASLRRAGWMGAFAVGASLRRGFVGGLLWCMVLVELYIINVKMGKMVKSAIFLKKKVGNILWNEKMFLTLHPQTGSNPQIPGAIEN